MYDNFVQLEETMKKKIRLEYTFRGRLSRVAETYLLDYKVSSGCFYMKRTLKRMWRCYWDTPRCLCPDSCSIHLDV